MIKLAIIGAGNHSSLHHGPAVAAMRNRFESVAVADFDLDKANQFAQQFGIDQIYDDAHQMVREFQPDALVVVTPEVWTAKVIRQLLTYQLPMLVEKPFGENVRQTRTLCREVAEANANIMVSFNRRFAPACTEAMQWLNNQFSDRPVEHVRGTMLRHDRHDHNFITATSIHCIDATHMFAGDHASEVQALPIAPSQDDRAAVSAQLTFANGATGQLLIHSDCGQLAETYDLYGNDYHIHVDYFQGITVTDSGKPILNQPLDENLSEAHREGAVAELATFLDRIESGDLNFSATPDHALAAAIIADQLEQSTLSSRNQFHEPNRQRIRAENLSTIL